MCDSIRQLGVVYHPIRQRVIVQEILRSFITQWIDDDMKVNDGPLDPNDVVFLRKVSDLYGESWSDISTALADKSMSLVRISIVNFPSNLFSLDFRRFLTR